MKKNILITLALFVCGTFIYLQATSTKDTPANPEVPQINQTESVVSSVSNETPDKVKSLPAFVEKSHNFGEVIKGSPVSHTFKFTNNGTEDLLIENVKPACGCTTKDYTKEAVAPGESGFVTLTYNAAKAGVFNKSASVMSNSEEAPLLVLAFKGEVVEK